VKLLRVYPDSQDRFALPPGSYGEHPDGTWWFRPPGVGHSGPLTEHTITEHEDGTITVEPSILTDEIHGYLIRGEWTAC
jgi:hypothetical protein